MTQDQSIDEIFELLVPGDTRLKTYDQAKKAILAMLNEARINELELEWTRKNRDNKNYLIDRLAQLNKEKA